MKPIVILGAGMAGLQAATELSEKGLPFVLLDRDERPGGRVKSDVVDGFILDHGFQVLQTNYPNVQSSLNLNALNLSSFDSGSKLWYKDQWIDFLNPLRHGLGFLSLVPSLISIKDIFLLARLWFKLQWQGNSLEESPESTAELLNRWGFSERFRSTFIEPFFRGIFLDGQLGQPASLFFFFMQQFLEGQAALPAKGMGAIAEQMLQGLPIESVRLGVEVTKLDQNFVELKGGERVEFERLIIALNPQSAADLLGVHLPQEAHLGVKTFYFSAPARETKSKLLRLLPSESGLLHYSFLSHVAPSYAPEGFDLIEVSTLDLAISENEVLESLANYEMVDGFRFIKSYEIAQSLPKTGFYSALQQAAEANGYLLAGDYTQMPSLQGAMVSGQKAADACWN
ncbi:MAG: FAD-dependent oxidoreductase [Aquirufa sp.]